MSPHVSKRLETLLSLIDVILQSFQPILSCIHVFAELPLFAFTYLWDIRPAVQAHTRMLS
jgi:hypothetical protein